MTQGLFNLFVALAILALQFPCALPASAAKSREDQAMLEDIRKKEAVFLRAAKSDDQRILDKLSSLLEAECRLVRLRIANSEVKANAAYLSEEPPKNFVCTMLLADDTIHTREGADYTPAKYMPGQPIKVLMPWENSQLASIDFYCGNAAEMHDNGYKNIKRVNFDRASRTLAYSLDDSKKRSLLFGIIKIKDDRFYRKFVFLFD